MDASPDSQGWSATGVVSAMTPVLDGALDAHGVVERDYTLSQLSRRWLAGDDLSAGSTLAEPTDPFRQSLWVNRCISEIQQTCSGIPLQLVRQGRRARAVGKAFPKRPAMRPAGRRGLRPLAGFKAVCVGRPEKADEIVETGEAADLLARPNGYQSWPQFIAATVGWLRLSGSVGWVMLAADGGRMTRRKPGELHAVPGRHIRPVIERDELGMPVLLGYLYRPPSSGREIVFGPDEVHWFFRWAATDNPVEGLSPLKPGRFAVSTDYAASLFNAAALSNNGEPGLVVSVNRDLTREQQDEFRQALRERHRGPLNARRDLVVGGATVDAFTSSFRDLQFVEGKGLTRLELCALLGVTPVVAGWLEKAGDSSAYHESARGQFYEQTIFPELDGLWPAVQDVVERIDPTLLAVWHVEDQPVVQQMRLSRVEHGRKLFDMGYPVNAINDSLDLGMPEVPWGDMGYLPTSLIPADEAGALPPLDEPAEPGEETARGIQGQRGSRQQAAGQTIDTSVLDRLWRAWQASWAPLAKTFERILRTRYVAQQRRLLRALREAMPESKGAGEKTDTEVIGRILLEAMGSPGDLQTFRARVETVAGDATELGFRQTLTEAGLDEEQAASLLRDLTAHPAVRAEIRSDAVRVAAHIDAGTRHYLRAQLAEGMDGGETVRQLADRVQRVMGNRRTDALRQARNAVSQTLSRARAQGRRAAGVTHEIWIHSRGPGERRESHVAAESYYRQHPKPAGEPFIVNGVPLRYPRDPAGPAGEVINCQCLAIGKRFETPAGRDVTAADVVGGVIERGLVTAEQLDHRGAQSAQTNEG